MSVQLLDKTRKINKLLHNNNSSKVVFNDICEVLTEILDSNVLVVSKKGKVLGGSNCEGVNYQGTAGAGSAGRHIDDMLNELPAEYFIHQGECKPADPWIFGRGGEGLSGHHHPH